MRPDSIGIAGSGRMAQALGRFLYEAGEPVRCVAGRHAAHARSAASAIGPDVQAFLYADLPRAVPRWLLAVSDGAVTEVAAILATRCDIAVALHTSGASGPESLLPLRARGAACGALHPLQTIASGPPAPGAFHGVAFAVCGDPAALAWAEAIAALAHGPVLRIAPHLRPFYHAAAVMAGNYVAALVHAAQTLMARAGVDGPTALASLAPLLRTSVENTLARGPVGALTGPIERGDLATVSAHLAALAEVPRPVRNLYRAAGLETVRVARRRGLTDAAAHDMERLLDG